MNDDQRRERWPCQGDWDNECCADAGGCLPCNGTGIDWRAYAEALEKEVDRLTVDGGAAAWMLHWLVADKYKKPDAPSMVQMARRQYESMLKERTAARRTLSRVRGVLHEIETEAREKARTDKWKMINGAYQACAYLLKAALQHEETP